MADPITREQVKRAMDAAVPQPEPWHARLVRLAQVAQDTSKACAEAEAAFKVADAERERTRLVRAAAREACHAARKALTAATTARAIIDAQQPASVQPTRPEPRYKVGDWVRVVTGPNSAGRTTPIRVTCVTSAGYIMADGASWAAENLTPALDPALHETARTAARMLLCGKWPLGLSRVGELPGFDAWNSGPLTSSEWAAQLDRLLGDAPCDDLRCEVEALQAERDTARLEAGRLRARLRAAEARIERVGAILSDEGCDCYCDCDSDGHNADCDLCLACRIDREVSP